MSPNYKNSREFLSLVSSLRGLSGVQVDRMYLKKKPVELSLALSLCLKKILPSNRDVNIITLMRSKWKQWFLNPLWLDCWPEKLEQGGVLCVSVSHPIVKQRVQFQTEKLICELNRRLRDCHIKEIRVWVKSA